MLKFSWEVKNTFEKCWEYNFTTDKECIKFGNVLENIQNKHINLFDELWLYGNKIKTKQLHAYKHMLMTIEEIVFDGLQVFSQPTTKSHIMT